MAWLLQWHPTLEDSGHHCRSQCLAQLPRPQRRHPLDLLHQRAQCHHHHHHPSVTWQVGDGTGSVDVSLWEQVMLLLLLVVVALLFVPLFVLLFVVEAEGDLVTEVVVAVVVVVEVVAVFEVEVVVFAVLLVPGAVSNTTTRLHNQQQRQLQ